MKICIGRLWTWIRVKLGESGSKIAQMVEPPVVGSATVPDDVLRETRIILADVLNGWERYLEELRNFGRGT